MKALQATEHIWWVGALDPDLRVFDIVMHSDHGTSYNSYLLRGSKKTALFETVKDKFFDEHLEKIFCVVFLALMSAIIVLQVFFRYVLNNSLSWSEELARYLFIWMIYIGISYGVKLDKHICVDAVYTFMPKSIKRGYAIVAYLLFLAFAVFIVYYGIMVVGMQISSGQVSPAMGLPMQYVYAAPVVGMILTIIRLIQKIYYALTVKEWED